MEMERKDVHKKYIFGQERGIPSLLLLLSTCSDEDERRSPQCAFADSSDKGGDETVLGKRGLVYMLQKMLLSEQCAHIQIVVLIYRQYC